VEEKRGPSSTKSAAVSEICSRTCPFPASRSSLGPGPSCVRDKTEHGGFLQGRVAEFGKSGFTGQHVRYRGNSRLTAEHWIADSSRSKRDDRSCSESMCLSSYQDAPRCPDHDLCACECTRRGLCQRTDAPLCLTATLRCWPLDINRGARVRCLFRPEIR
jgi:hypothetical protein